MRINPDFPIQQRVGANVQKNTAERVGGETGDVLAIDAKVQGVRAADQGVRASQNAMTLFRIADDSLAKMEDALVRMTELTERAAEDVSGAARENMRLEMEELAEVIRFAGENTTMGGVPVFGGDADTAAMWSAAVQNVQALSPNDDNARIERVADTGLEALGLDGLSVGTKDAAIAAGARIEAAGARISGDRETMAAQAGRMGELAREEANRSVASFSATRITDSDTAAGLMAFIRDALGAAPDLSVLAQARQSSFDVAAING